MGIILKNVSKVFTNQYNKQKYQAISQINLKIKKGEFISLLGPSGCGKSTILYMISGLQKVTQGQIFFENKNVTNIPPEKRGVGLVFQNYALYPHMTARQNIMFPLQNLKIPKEKIDQEIQRIANLASIEEYLDKKPSELSGGQQQRVAIGRALIKNPKVLLLDEPLSNLDTRLRLKMRNEIKRIQKKTKITAIFVTHDQEEAMSISDRIFVMNKGAIQQADVPSEIYNNPTNLFVASFLGVPHIALFNGKLNNCQLKIGETIILNNPKWKNLKQEVHVGIRPEGFLLEPHGKLKFECINIGNMGRELILLVKHSKSIYKNFQIIIPANEQKKFNLEHVYKKEFQFNIKENKCFVFDKISGNRIF